MLKISNLSKKFHQHAVLEDVSLSLEQGELILLTGPNGCGKTTLFKLICDILEADQGSITIDAGVSIGALIENPTFVENQNIHFNLSFLAGLNRRYDEGRIVELCDRFQLNYRDKTKMKNYSLGMRQKAGIIQAVMENQNLILLDEPVRGLDEKALQTFTQLIEELIKEGKTVVIASHDPIQELHYTRKLRMENGKIHEMAAQ